MVSLLTRASMLVGTEPDTLLRDLPEPEGAVLRQRMSEITQEIVLAGSARQLRRLVTELLPAYGALRHLVDLFIVERMATGKVSLHDETARGTTEILYDLVGSNIGVLTRQDRGILLDWLQEQTRSADALPKVPPENQQAMLRAVLDGFWFVKGAELAAFTVILVSTGQLTPTVPGVPHWLCLEVRRYLKEWRSALFANDPELRRRLAEPAKLLTTGEMEQRFGV